MANIKYLISNEEKIPVFLCLDTSNGHERDLEWHFFSDYMHDASIFVCNMQAFKQAEISEIKKIISQIRDETRSESIGIIEICCNKDNSNDVVVLGSWLIEDSTLYAAIKIILESSKLSHSFRESEIKTNFFEKETRVLRIEISDNLLKNRTISYDIDGVKQSKIATVVASIVTVVEGATAR